MQTLCELFYHSVDTYRKPDHLLHKKDGVWKGISSAELLQTVEEVSMGLSALGVQKGDRVAILAENRPEWAFADLAVLTAGAEGVPIYATLTPPQVLYLLKDSEAKVIFVSTAAQAAKVAAVRSEAPFLKAVIRMDDAPIEGTQSIPEVRARGREALEKDKEAVRRRSALVQADEVATIVYTSGTTGEPKGVMLTHRNLVSNVLASEEVFEDLTTGPGDLLLSFLPLCHVFERMAGHYLMLYIGATIAYAESLDAVPQNMREVRPTLLCAVPRFYEKIHARIQETVAAGSPLRKKLFAWALEVGRERLGHRIAETKPGLALKVKYALADALVFSKIRAGTGGRLRLFVSGSAPLSPEIGKFFGSIGLEILEGYGLTETSPVIAVNRPGHPRPGTVGRPIQGVEVKIAPDGEILARGPNVMKGYYKKPQATAEVLDKDGWFHTGDIGVLDADGYLSVTDRKKDLIVTSGGKKVAPQPIENRLKLLPLFEDVVMVGNERNFPAALVVPNFANLEKWAKEKGVGFQSRQELVSRKEVKALYDEAIADVNRDLAQFEKIKKVTILPGEFSQAAGELTPTLKVKRKVVEDKYRDVIEEMYTSHSEAS